MLRRIAKQVGQTLEQQWSFSRTLSSSAALRMAKQTEAAADQPVTYKDVKVSRDNNITLIGINRPQQRNAIDSHTAQQLCEVFSHFEADDTSPVAVLYGLGGSFCSGFDILEMGTDEKEEISVDILMRSEGSVGPTRRLIKKPVVCGINGYCIANGLELALMCDLRVMEESAVLGFFNRRFGVPMLDGGTVRLPAMIGLSRAMDLVLTGRPVGAQEAHQIGLINRIVPTGTALENAIQLAGCLARFPQRALNHDRNSLYSAAFETSTFHQAVQNEVMYTSREIIDELQNGIKWFNQKFKTETTYSWLKREKSMADWDDEEVVVAADEVEKQKKEQEIARIEAEKKKQAEKEKKAKKSAESKEKDTTAAQGSTEKTEAATTTKTEKQEPKDETKK